MTKTETITAYPLTWPIGRPRAVNRTHSRFGRESRSNGYSRRERLAIGDGRDELIAELNRLGAKKVIISTNIRTREDGLPYANAGGRTEKNSTDPIRVRSLVREFL
jgi:hypothetical protein